MGKKKITWQFKNFRIYKDLYGKPCKRDWMAKVVFLIQMLLTFGGRCNRYFWDIRLKILRLPNFNMLFQLVLTKFFKSELFSCLPKVDHVIKSCKEPIIYAISLMIMTCIMNFVVYLKYEPSIMVMLQFGLFHSKLSLSNGPRKN